MVVSLTDLFSLFSLRALTSACAVALALSALLVASACGDEIGDECSLGTDCSTQGDRICDTTSPNGYCTIIGCDVGSCPDEAVCVRFFSVTDSNRPCNPTEEDLSENACSADEVCTFSGSCAPKNSEVRFCMKTCEDNDDCRDQYECRDESLMRERGGESVPELGEPTGSNIVDFCAAAP